MNDDFMAAVRTTIRDATKMKARMLAKGLRKARAKCPECEGELHASLAGPKNHIRFACTGSCHRRMME